MNFIIIYLIFMDNKTEMFINYNNILFLKMFGKKKERKDNKKLKEDRFKRIASRRVKEILNKMRLLKNCANKSNYVYNSEQVRKIIHTIDDEWKKVKLEFSKHKSKKEFTL